MPARRERAGLRLAVADHAGDQQVGVVEGRPVRMDERVAQLAALVDGAGVSGATWLGMPPGKENCRNSRRMPFVVLADSG